MKRRTLMLASAFAAAASPQAKDDKATLQQRVADAERGFAAAMAKRDHQAFAAFLSEEAVFLGNGDGKNALRGKRAVADGWKRFFEAPNAPFSWGPEVVEVVEPGNLALSTGPVKSPAGDTIGRFTSIWRLEPDGKWRIVFDRGCSECRP